MAWYRHYVIKTEKYKDALWDEYNREIMLVCEGGIIYKIWWMYIVMNITEALCNVYEIDIM